MQVKIIFWNRRYLNEKELKKLRELVEKNQVFIVVREEDVKDIPLHIRNRAIIVAI